MKKKLPVILLLFSLCILLIGIIGFAQQNHSKPSPQHSTSSIDKCNKSRSYQADLLDVNATIGNSEIQIKDYTGFRVAFDAANHTPRWVSWELLGSETDGDISRSSKFWQDSEINGCPNTTDYTGSGFDRGHMCPAADQKWSSDAMHDCFSLANIAPQDHKLNTGAWKTLETKERSWAQRDSALIIVAGPIYSSSNPKQIGKIGIKVPDAYFKIIAAPYLESPRGIAFVYPNMTAPGNMENYVMTIREVEKLTGLDFLHDLPDDIESIIESSTSFRDWNKR